MKILLLWICVIVSVCAKAQLVVNEFSQGKTGSSQEYIELVVVGTNTCTNSTADLRNWVFDDQNGWYGGNGTGIATGNYRFKNVSNWAAVPYGSIILLYNSLDKSTSITIPDDPTDANKDYVYVVPISSNLIEENPLSPVSPSSSSFSYPAAGYGNTVDWVSGIGLANSGDAVIITSPTVLNKAYFSIVYGFVPGSGYQTPNVVVGNVGSNSNCYLNDDQYNNSASWLTGTAGVTETPGIPNSAANKAWIENMRKPAVTPLPTNATQCMNDGSSYNFNGNTLTSTGYYTTTYKPPGRCDSVVNLYLSVFKKENQAISGCDSVLYNGTTYKSSQVVKENYKSSVALNCDSLERTITITVNKSVTKDTNVCIPDGTSYLFDGTNLTVGGPHTATFKTATGCDSIVNLYLTVTRQETQNITGCNTVTYNGVTYNSSQVVNENFKSSVSGCDSLLRTVNITVAQPISIDTNICRPQGQSYLFNGITLTTTGTYHATFKKADGCDSTVNLYLTIPQTATEIYSGCESYEYNGTVYTSSTTTSQTIKSQVSGCDSLYKTINIIINKNSDTTKLIQCLKAGSSYNFNGSILTKTGSYNAMYKTSLGCDSVVNLFLTVATDETLNLSNCSSLSYNGVLYTTSTVVKDDIKSKISGCDSINRTVIITIANKIAQNINGCIKEGDSYSFNNQSLTKQGDYSATFTTSSGCDSTVYLHLTVAQQITEALTGCEKLDYNGKTYTSSTVIYDTAKSKISGCDSLYRTVRINIGNGIVKKINGCIKEGETYFFNNDNLTKGGNYSATYKTTFGCDSIVSLYLTVATHKEQTIGSCTVVSFEGKDYFSSTDLNDTIHSFISGCDSVYRRTHINISKSITNDVNVCLNEGESYTFNNTKLTATGKYAANFTTGSGCDSTVNLYLTVAAKENLLLSNCRSITYNGIQYNTSQTFPDTIKSLISGCDSIHRTVNIDITDKGVTTNKTGCIKEGESYSFNGNNLTLPGSYSATLIASSGCDSTVNLYLTVARKKDSTIANCTRVIYKGVSYTSSQIIQDTVKSEVSGCDSLYKAINIIISDKIVINTSGCIKAGESYTFGNRQLTIGGTYTNTFATSDGCDSTVNLYLTVAGNTSETIQGCGSVFYNGKSYTSSTLFKDTVKSFVSGCDSLYKEVNLVINPLPQGNITGNLKICKGENTTLTASGNASSVRWLSSAEGNVITVSPQSTTTYQLEASNSQGCRDTITATVSVEDFVLALTATPNPAGSGSVVSLTTSSAISYNILAWQPAALFALQTASSQTLRADTTTTITVIGQSSSNSCLDTSSINLVVTKTNPNDLFIPNAFTPNGDGVNDRFLVYGTTIKEYTLMIFSQWGEVLYESKNSTGWDGNAKGKQQPVGVYVYTAVITMNDGTMVTRKGSVNLIR